MAAFTPPSELDVTDKHGGFTILTYGSAMGHSTLWRPGDVAPRGTVGSLLLGSVRRDDQWQGERPVISAEYHLPGYRYRVKVWFRANGERIA